MTTDFSLYQLDLDRRQLLRDGEPVHLSPKALQLLQILIAERPKALSKAEITDKLWPATFVAESNLSSVVKELRRALEDDARAPRFIRTVHGYGYAFCWEEAARGEKRAQRFPVALLSWSTGESLLFEGRNVIGRGSDAAACIDDRTVSRYHAAIDISGENTTLEDIGSKNGTFIGTRRITAPVRLRDGSTFAIGSVQVTYHVSSDLSTRSFSRL